MLLPRRPRALKKTPQLSYPNGVYCDHVKDKDFQYRQFVKVKVKVKVKIILLS